MASRGHGDKLSRLQERAIAALLTWPTLARAAAQAGVSLRTLRGWLELPHFEAAFRAARARILDQTVTHLARLNVRAVRTLRRNLNCGSASVEVRAAVAVLELSLRLRETSELVDRLEALERAEQQRQAERQHSKSNGRASWTGGT